MNKVNNHLAPEEQEILNAFETDTLPSIADVDQEMKRIQKIAKAYGNKNRRVNLRLSENDFLKAQETALQEGLPYQTLLSSILHKYFTGQLTERRDQ